MNTSFAKALDKANNLIKENTEVDRRIAFTSLIQCLKAKGINIISQDDGKFTIELMCDEDMEPISITVGGHVYNSISDEIDSDNQEDQEEISPISAARDIAGQDEDAPEEQQVRRSYSNLMRTVQGRIDDITRKLH